jgi:hypothetical protein
MSAEYKTPAAVQKALRAGKKSTGDGKVSKSSQVPGLPFKDSFKPKPGYWGGRCHSCPKLTQKRSFGLTRTVDLSQSVTSAKTLRSEIIEAK